MTEALAPDGLPVLVAGAAAGVAVLLARPGRSPVRSTSRSAARWGGLVAVLPVSWLAVRSGLWVPVLIVGLAAVGGYRWWVVRRRRASAEETATQVLHACEGLAADLAAGLEPGTALARSGRDWPVLRPVAGAHGLGASVPSALRLAAAAPGAADLRVVAAAWEVGHESGPGLATGLGQVARSLRADRATRRVVAAELASARATARLLALLPFGVLVLGSGSGGDPWRFLLHTPPGWVCLAAGLLLLALGLVWLESLAAGVTR